MEVISIIVFAVTFILLLKFLGKSRQEKYLDLLPGPAGYPIIGNFFDILKTKQSFLAFTMENGRAFGPIYKTWIGSTPMVHISKPQYVETILNTDGIVKVPDKNSLLTKALKLHPYDAIKNRNVVLSTMNSKDPEHMIDIVTRNCGTLLDTLKEKSVEDLSGDWITLCVLDIICEILLGVKINAQLGKNESFVSSLLQLKELSKKNYKVRFYSDSLFRLTSFGKEYNTRLNVVHDFLHTIIKNKNCENSPNDKTDALHDLLLYNGMYTAKEIPNEILNIVITALDSIDLSIHAVLYVLGKYPSIQSKTHQEIENISSKRGCSNITLKDLQRMTYFDKVIKETFRLYPICPFILKELERNVKLGRYQIPHGTTVCIEVINLHRDPEVFPGEDNFDPNHFNAQKGEKRSRFAYIPFTNCIGQKLTEIVQRTMLTILIRRFQIDTIDNTSDRITSITNCIFGRESEIKVRISPR